MPYLLNFFYLLLVVLVSPWLLWKYCTTGKYRDGLRQKVFGLVPPIAHPECSCIWFHGVSVGEVLLLQPLVESFRRSHPDCHIVLSTTTNTGMEQLRKRFPNDTIFYFPLDFTWAVRRAIQRIQPDLIVLAESELWPNFLHFAKEAGAKIAVINGRLSPASYRRYMKFRPIVRTVFDLPDLWCMQTMEYANYVLSLGARNVHVCGSIKYDNVNSNRENEDTARFRRLFGITANDVVWIAGSTQSPEEEIAAKVYGELKGTWNRLRLILVPRQRERFDEVARLLERLGMPYVKRSSLSGPLQDRSSIILVDTIGELKAIWGLADIAYVGGSMDGKRGGQSMIEPAGYGAAVLFGPHVWNFKDTTAQLVTRNAAIQVHDARELKEAMIQLIEDQGRRIALGQRAKEFIASQQGATAKTISLISTILPSKSNFASSAA